MLRLAPAINCALDFHFAMVVNKVLAARVHAISTRQPIAKAQQVLAGFTAQAKMAIPTIYQSLPQGLGGTATTKQVHFSMTQKRKSANQSDRNL